MFGLEPIFEEGLRELLDAANKLKDAAPKRRSSSLGELASAAPSSFPLLSNRQSGDKLPLRADRQPN
jgi:hypothetical protein